jgi:pyrimidine-nucleoside phosphorylase
VDFQSIIATRRDGGMHSREELDALAQAAARGDVPDYQLSAWLMAAYLNPLTPQETAWLTLAMAESGDRLDLTGLPRPWVDKHSTGGVGDKTTLVLLPLLAACGLTSVKMSGRGLGITGGTIDKLASIPGFRTDLSPAEMKEQAARFGLALTGQTPALAPADKALYALRDATATVASVPLIVSSVLSKKIAGGAEKIVLDVKAGSGAFMKTLDDARRLALALRETADLAGIDVRIAITDMDQPLGRMVGNALEVREAIHVLAEARGGRFADLCLELAGLTLEAADLAQSREEGADQARAALESGAALAKAKLWFEAQGADPSLLDDASALPEAEVVVAFLNPGSEGCVQRVDAQIVGEVVVALGGGRMRKEDEIDPAVGVECLVAVGDAVVGGQPLLRVHARSEEQAAIAVERLRSAVTVVSEPVDARPLVFEIL